MCNVYNFYIILCNAGKYILKYDSETRIHMMEGRFLYWMK